MKRITVYKSYAALATGVAAAMLAEFGPDGPLGVTLTVVTIAGGVFATWRAPYEVSE
jgi:hypothetical protein